MAKYAGWYETGDYRKSGFTAESDNPSMMAVSDIVMDLLAKGAKSAVIHADLGRPLKVGESDVMAQIWRDGTFNFYWDEIAHL